METDVMQERIRGGAVRSDVVWSSLMAVLRQRPGARVIDVGGGTGSLAVALAGQDCAVTVVDTSPDALATLRRRAQEAGIADRITAVQGDFDSLPDGPFDLVLCHSVLEYVDDVDVAIAHLAEHVAEGGTLSLLVATRAATVISRALAGHVRQARHAWEDADGRWGEKDGMLRRFDTEGVLEVLGRVGLHAQQVHGVGVFADLVPTALAQEPDAREELRELERQLCTQPPYRDLARQLHVLAGR